MSKYRYYQAYWRAKAVQWQADLPGICACVLDHQYYLDCQALFERAARRYGLTREFRENGII